jgi:hypothetical protein
MMDSIADRTYSSLIALLDWLVLAMVEAADPRSHRGDPPDFAAHLRGQAVALKGAVHCELRKGSRTVAEGGACARSPSGR